MSSDIMVRKSTLSTKPTSTPTSVHFTQLRSSLALQISSIPKTQPRNLQKSEGHQLILGETPMVFPGFLNHQPYDSHVCMFSSYGPLSTNGSGCFPDDKCSSPVEHLGLVRIKKTGNFGSSMNRWLVKVHILLHPRIQNKSRIVQSISRNLLELSMRSSCL